MRYKYFSRNGEILPVEQAVTPLDDIAYAYGYGVYETIRVVKDVPGFLREHCERLLGSAQAISLLHQFSIEAITTAVMGLVEKTAGDTYNLKVQLIGGKTAEDATLYIQCLNPHFPDRKLYREGVTCITIEYERPFPHAKTLNMLPSYLAYRDAKAASAYEALFVNRHGCIVEGTRTNFFCMKGKTITTPPEEDILLGVTRKTVLEVAKVEGYDVLEQDIPLANIDEYDAAFITSTSTKIMPIRAIGDTTIGPPSDQLQQLMKVHDAYLTEVWSR